MNNILFQNPSPFNHSIRNIQKFESEKNIKNNKKNYFRGTLYNYNKVNEGSISARETPYLPMLNMNNTGEYIIILIVS